MTTRVTGLPTTSAKAAPALGWFALTFIVALVPLLTTPLLPCIDLYNHLARYFVLANISADPVLQRNYSANWLLLPNIGLDVIGTAFVRSIPQRLAAHAVVGLIFAVQFVGLLAFNRMLTGRRSLLVAVLIVPLLYSFIFNWGFTNFLLGLGLVFAAAAWWLYTRTRLCVGLPIACTTATIIFLTHGIDFALYGLLIAMLEVGLWLQHARRQIAPLAAALVPVVVQAIVPVILFAATTTSRAGAGVSNAGASVNQLITKGVFGDRLWSLFCYRLLTIVRVEEGPALWFDVATFVVQIALVVWLAQRGRARVHKAAVPAIICAAVLVALTPPALFGVGYVADRMPLFLGLLVVGALSIDLPRIPTERVVTGMLFAVVAVRLMAITASWQVYRGDLAEFEGVARTIPPGATVYYAFVGGNRHDDSRRCQMYGPMLVSRHRAIAPLFANETQQPLRLVGPLRRELDVLLRAIGPSTALSDNYRQIAIAAGPAGFDALLLCHAEPLTTRQPGRVLANSAHFTVLWFKRGERLPKLG